MSKHTDIDQMTDEWKRWAKMYAPHEYEIHELREQLVRLAAINADLLAACEALLGWWDDPSRPPGSLMNSEALFMMRAAVARAKGGSL